MNPEFHPIALPVEPNISPQEAPPVSPRVALWRWWVATIIIGCTPLLATLFSSRRTEKEAMLPQSVEGLLLFCAFQLGVFGVVWGIAWAFARANKDDLLLRWRGGWKPVGWGVLYSVGMRFGLVLVAIVGLTVLTLVGFDPKQIMETLQKNGQGAKEAFEPVMEHGTALYRFLMISLVSFVVAGLREELWRTFTMVGLRKIMPERWSQRARDGFSLLFTCVLFGSGHIYQGATGVAGTTLLGIVLGAIILRHKSIWPAVIAHGCFNAVSFAALATLSK